MPPFGKPRPSGDTYDVVVSVLEAAHDTAAAERPRPGRSETFRRLNRVEYGNAIRDLLALDIDTTELLPADASGHGFDNVTVADRSSTHLERFVTVAETINRLAVGGVRGSPSGETIRVRPNLTQEKHVDSLPLGTRGGVLLHYNFPADGEYDIQLRLARDRDEHVEGLKEPHDLEVLLDRKRVAGFTVKPPKDQNHEIVDDHLKVRISADAGPHDVGVTFVKNTSALLETRRKPYNAHFNRHRHPRLTPAVYQVSITEPYVVAGRGDTPSRRRIFVCRPEKPSEEDECAKRIISALTRRAYRGPVTDAELEGPMAFYREARSGGASESRAEGVSESQAQDDFEAGIERALSAVLVSPRFLFRIERDPLGVAPETVYEISPLELASRLSFFLWSSIPDDELLEAASAGALREPAVLKAQVRRLLADERAEVLVSHFASQWLYLRNLDSTIPDLRLFPDFDDNLRQALRKETELFVSSVLSEDRSVLDLLKADYTFLNERLAKHYGIPHVYGSRFRRVALDESSHRGGAPSPRQSPDRNLLRDENVARPAWTLDSRELARHPSTPATRECSRAPRQHRGGRPFCPGAFGRAPVQPGLRELS